jgi:hypothetical protein
MTIRMDMFDMNRRNNGIRAWRRRTTWHGCGIPLDRQREGQKPQNQNPGNGIHRYSLSQAATGTHWMPSVDRSESSAAPGLRQLIAGGAPCNEFRNQKLVDNPA